MFHTKIFKDTYITNLLNLELFGISIFVYIVHCNSKNVSSQRCLFARSFAVCTGLYTYIYIHIYIWTYIHRMVPINGRELAWESRENGARLANIYVFRHKGGPNWGPPSNPSIRYCCDGPRGFRVALNWAPRCRESPVSRTAARLIAVVVPLRRGMP